MPPQTFASSEVHKFRLDARSSLIMRDPLSHILLCVTPSRMSIIRWRLLSATCTGTSRTAKLLIVRKAKKSPQLPKNVQELFVRYGRKGGKTGGKARWKGTTPEERSEIARKAANARWRKAKSE